MVSAFFVDGFPCRLESPIIWTLYTGPQYRVATFPMTIVDAERVLKLDKLVTLTYSGRDQKKMVFEKVVIVGEGPSGSPFHRMVQFADIRYFWPRKIFSRNFNETISSPVTRTVSPTGIPLSLQKDVNDLQFARYSINPATKKPWMALELLEAVLSEIVGQKDRDWVIAPAVNSLPNAQVQDLDMPGPGDTGVTAIASALDRIPGANIYQGYDGRIYVDSQLPGRADAEINGLGPPLEPGEFIRKVDRSHDRGRRVRVWFPMELGVRFDAYSPEDTFTDDDPWMRNVASTVLPSTTLPDGSVVPPGTVVDIDDFITTSATYMTTQSNLAPYVSSPPRAFTRANILAKYLQGLENSYCRVGTSSIEPDPVGGAMCKEIYNSLFLRYQINPRWAHNCLAIIPKMVGIVDPETGAEADAAVYSDHAIKPAFKTFARLKRKELNNLSINKYCAVPPGWTGTRGRLATGVRGDGAVGVRRSPAKMSTVTRAGVFDLNYSLDPLGFEAEIVPDTIVEATIPSLAYNSEVALFNQSRLENSHRVNVICTIVPAPQGRDKDGLFRHMAAIDIFPADAAKKLGLGSIGECLGIEVTEDMAAIQPAKFPYDDDPDAQQDIRSCIGLTDDPDGGGVASNYTGPFFVNTGPGPATPINLADLQELALGMAASYYMERLDRFAGSQTVPLRSDLVPIGEIAAVSHILMTDGTLETTVFCDRDANEDIDPLALLPTSARRTLLRTVNPTGA